jgi:hypothetical protein
MFKDRRRALWRAPFHLLFSVPVAIATLVAPSVGTAYINWRVAAEKADEATGRDTPEKAAIDLTTQTVLVRGVLKIWKR